MTKLKYLTDENWAKLPMPDFRQRFFIESYIEKLRMYTPHFYQARLMNIFSSCSEALEYVDAYRANEKNSGYLVSSIKEVADCWDGDTVAQEILSDLGSLRISLFRSVQAGELGGHVLNRISALCRAVLARRDAYRRLLSESLSDAIVGPAELGQKDRITSEIDKLTGLYVTSLLNQRFSPTYLFNRAEMLYRRNSYSGRDFSEQLEVFFQRLRAENLVDFDTYYGIKVSRADLLLSIHDEPELSFSEGLPDGLENLRDSAFSAGMRPNVVAKCTIKATDYISAAFRAKERIDKFMDLASALEVSPKLHISKGCVVVHRQGVAHKRVVDVDMLLAFMSSEVGSYFSDPGPSIRKSLDALNDDAKEQIGRSLRHLRLARSSVSLEQKLLNLWIALESIFSGGDSSILANILEYVPHFYAVAGLERRVSYLRGLLVENKVSIGKLFLERICSESKVFDQRITDNHVFAMIMDEDVVKELFFDLEGKEHLRFRLFYIFKELKDNKCVSARIKKTQDDVGRQLRRIYFLRNKIAHTGHFQGVRPQLVTHLLDYVVVCYRAITYTCSVAPPKNTYAIAEILASARMGVDAVIERASSNTGITSLNDLMPVSVV